MEDGAILNMVEDTFRHLFFIVDAIVSDYYSTMQAVLNNPSTGVQCQVLKSSK